jgi:hypothetical protein
MTPDEIAADAAEAERAINDPAHPWHHGVRAILEAWPRLTRRQQLVVRAIAPYLFDGDGKMRGPK